MERIILFLPRLHPNVRGWLSDLDRGGVEIAILVISRTVLDEKTHHLVEVVPKSFLSGLVALARRGRLADFETTDDFFRANFIPNALFLWAKLRKYRDATLVLRDWTLASHIFFIVAKLTGLKRVVVYDQLPLSGGLSQHQPKSKYPKAVDFWSRFSELPSFTPVKAAGGSAQEDNFQEPKSRRRAFLPFQIPQHEISPSEKEGGSSRPVRVLCVGKFRSYKALTDVVEVVTQLPSDIQQQVKVVIAGHSVLGAGDSTLNTLRNEIQKSGLESNFGLAINKEREEMTALYCQSDILLFPGRIDLAPIAPVEAMAHGVVPIVSNSIGTAGYIAHAISGFLFDPGRLDQAAGFLRSLVENRSLLRKMQVSAGESYLRATYQGQFISAIRQLTETED